MSKAQRSLDEWLAWCDIERNKHRVMTTGEHFVWCYSGDAISSPSEGNPFPGGLTILFDKPAIIGKTK